MTTFVFRLKAPRPDFALSLTDSEREIELGRMLTGFVGAGSDSAQAAVLDCKI